MDQATLTENEDADLGIEPAPEPSMRETMEATLAAINSRNAETDQKKEVKSEKPRAQDGKFLKQTQEKSDAQTAQPESSPVAEVKKEEPTKPTELVSNVRAPASWTAAAKEEFLKSSPVIQQEVLRREQQMHDGISQYKQAANYGQQMYKTIQPFENTIREWGVTPDVAVKALFTADHKLRNGSPQEKLAAFADLAKGYGVDLSQGLPAQQEVDPNVAYFQRQQYQMQQALHQTQEQTRRLQEYQAKLEENELNNLLSQAKQGKPHFDELSVEIGSLLQAAINRNQPITIDQAYDAALWASPKHRDALLSKQAAERKAAEDKQRAEEVARAKAARQASSVNVQKRGTLPMSKKTGTMRETLEATLAEIQSR